MASEEFCCTDDVVLDHCNSEAFSVDVLNKRGTFSVALPRLLTTVLENSVATLHFGPLYKSFIQFSE